MSIQRRDIVIVDFSYSKAIGNAVRPTLVVQADELNASLNATVLAMITSNRSSVGHPLQYLMETAHPNFPASGLRSESVIQSNILTTRLQSAVLRVIGSLSAPPLCWRLTSASRQFWGFPGCPLQGAGDLIARTATFHSPEGS